jgi:hypothetical protein
LSHAFKVFESGEQTKREQKLERKNTKRKRLVGELTLELKKRGVLRGSGKDQEIPRRRTTPCLSGSKPLRRTIRSGDAGAFGAISDTWMAL